MKVFLDTSLLVELHHPLDAGRRKRALRFLKAHVDQHDLVCASSSVYLELQFTLTRAKKSRGWSLSPADAARIVERARAVVVEPLLMQDVDEAMALQAAKNTPIRDGAHLVVARRLHCEKFLTCDAPAFTRVGKMRIEVLASRD